MIRQTRPDDNDKLRAERDAAHAENERLRNLLGDMHVIARDRAGERDAAHAENERLRNKLNLPVLPAQLYRQIINEREAWRACAERLNEELREALSYVPKHFVIKHAIGVEALAVYEQLKAGDQ